MKKTSTFFALVSILFLLAFSSNPPNGRTGAPNEGTCASCHGGNAPIEGSVRIDGLPDRVIPGEAYDITVRALVSSGTATRAGFQLVALDENNENVGTLAEPGNNVGFESFNSRNYAEHRSAKNFGGSSEVTYDFQWIAPEDKETGTITMYAVSVLANGNGNSGGDRVVTSNTTSEIDVSTSLVQNELAESIRIFPNPTADYIHFSWNSTQPYHSGKITLTDLSGRVLIQQPIAASSTQESIDLSGLNHGMYLARIEIDGSIATKKIMKL